MDKRKVIIGNRFCTKIAEVRRMQVEIATDYLNMEYLCAKHVYKT